MNASQFVGYARKFLVALAAALAILVVALSDDVITRLEWIQVAIAFLGALGVYVTPNDKLKEINNG